MTSNADTLQFRETETLGSRVLISCEFFIHCFLQNGIAWSRTKQNVICNAPHTSLADVRLKLDCVNNVMQCTVHTTVRLGRVTRLPLKTSTQYRKFLDNFTQCLTICSPRVKHARDVRSFPTTTTYILSHSLKHF